MCTVSGGGMVAPYNCFDSDALHRFEYVWLKYSAPLTISYILNCFQLILVCEKKKILSPVICFSTIYKENKENLVYSNPYYARHVFTYSFSELKSSSGFHSSSSHPKNDPDCDLENQR